VYDNGAYYHYTYDAAGERVLKVQSTGQRVFVNGQWKAGSGQMGNYTVYVNPYIVLRSGGYTKHYYIEGQRIVSKLGGGIDNNGKGPLQAGNGKVDYAARGQRVFDGIVKNLKFLGDDGQILTAGKSGKIPPGQVNGTGNVTEAFRYFYHPDHLGSTSYVTDASGEVYQHLEYFAFGETFVEEHSNTNRTPYLFNGKELDEETGLYYYGARYYDPRTSVWESVDPMAERGPGWSPYNYNFDNPLRYIDPTGMWPDFSLSDVVHTSLDVVGLVPGFGEIADGVNAVIYLAEGNYADAALSAASMIPLAGNAVAVAKMAKKVDKAVSAAKAAAAAKALDKAREIDKAAEIAKAAEKAKAVEKAQERADKLSKVSREGEDFTKAGKESVIDLNKAKNDGVVKCEKDVELKRFLLRNRKKELLLLKRKPKLII
jgi:RHS repeat-associated protein